MSTVSIWIASPGAAITRLLDLICLADGVANGVFGMLENGYAQQPVLMETL